MRKITLMPAFLLPAFLLLSFVLLACHISGCSNLEEPAANTQELSEIGKEDCSVENIEIVIGDTIYSAQLYDNEAAQALAAQLPLTLDMNELNGNEKYFYLTDSLPVNSGVPAGINAGDLMLYGSDCLVLFYKSFSTSYSYTPLGHVDDPESLAQTLSSGSVQITFQKSISS